jgi:hypothetical protein
MLIRDLVTQTLKTGFLSIEAEDKLRQLLLKGYETEDLVAFIKLQQAAMNGLVVQESREIAKFQKALTRDSQDETYYRYGDRSRKLPQDCTLV